MEKLILDQQTLNRIPSVFIFLLILTLGLPVVAFNLFNVNFNIMSQHLGVMDTINNNLVEAQIRGYFREAILQWSAFSLSAITVLLAFTQYQLSHDKIALVIGLAILFSGSLEALNAILVDGIAPQFINKSNLDAAIWTFSNTVSGLILIVGLPFLLSEGSGFKFSLTLFAVVSIFMVLIGFTLIYDVALMNKLPEMWHPDATLSRPYELIYLVIYLIIATVLYPKIYKKYNDLLTHSVFYIAITEIVIALYMMLLSNNPYDSAYNVAYFLKIIVYFIPFCCLIFNYVNSYKAVLQTQIKLQISKDKLKYIAGHDALTNLYNRREFENQIIQKIANSERENSTFALFLIDIDNFKTINDTLGHAYGDDYIIQFANQFRSLTRKGDIISRIGGDEFTLITSRLKSENDVDMLAERLVKGLHTILTVGTHTLPSTTSIGVAVFPDNGRTSQELLRKADIALYEAKTAGKNTYRIYVEPAEEQEMVTSSGD